LCDLRREASYRLKIEEAISDAWVMVGRRRMLDEGARLQLVALAMP
jgi:hypothetical protein